MKARYCQALPAVVAGLLASAPFAPLAAQVSTVRPPDPNAPRLVVEVFKSAEKNAGVQASDALRTRITQDAGGRNLYVLPKQDITNNLEASGFPTTEALNMNDARALSQLLRGDIFLTGDIVKDAAGYKVTAYYVLTRDASLVQPLGSYTVSKPDGASGQISKEFQAALKGFTAERDCINRAREGKYAEAKAAAQKGIAAYPNSTLSRICLVNVLVTEKAAADSIISVSNEVLKIYPMSRPALAANYDALKTANRANEATDVLIKLVGADPSNTKLVEQVINEFAANGQAAKAIPFVDQLVRDNAGDPNYLLLQSRVHIAAKDYKGGIAAGEELIRSDTASATPEFFTRLAAAASVDSQPQKAAQLLAQAVAKFPTNSDLLQTYIQVLGQSGQNQQALDMLNRAIAGGSKISGLHTQRAKLLSDMSQPDSAFASLQQAVTAGDSAGTVALYALSIGQSVQKAAAAAKDFPGFEKAIRIFDFSVKTNATPEGNLLLGAAAYTYATQLLGEAQRLSKGSAADKAQACAYSKTAQEQFNTARINVPLGGRANAAAAQQILGSLEQYAGYADQFAKALCK